jgi:hypothetical protein
MKGRTFIAGLGSAAVWPLAARAQQAAMPVIGWLDTVPGTMECFLPPFEHGLAETGYVVGRYVTIEHREGDRGRLPALAADLVRRNVRVIVAVGGGAALVAKAATQTIPVVFMMASDPVEDGVVASLNRPSNNLTGIAAIATELAGKRLELLRKLVPAADPIAMLGRSSSSELMQAETKALQSAASILGVRLLVLSAVTEAEVAAAFATIVEQHAGALAKRGRAASTPSDIPPKGWKDILWRVYHNVPKHRVIAIAAGVTFYVLLAIFPGIAALVAIYGLIADPLTIGQHLSDLSGVLPGGATEVIGDQLQRLTSQPPGKLGFALLFGVVVSLWSANAGMKALFDAMARKRSAAFSSSTRCPSPSPWVRSSSWCSRSPPLPCSRS